MDYAWDETHVNIYVKEGTNLKRLEHFFNVMGTDYLGPGIIKKLESHGFNCVERIYKLKKTDLLKIEGFQDKSADKLLESIRETFSKERPLSVCLCLDDFWRKHGFQATEIGRGVWAIW